MLGSLLRFSLTGGAATLVHLAVAMLLIQLYVQPLFGNAVAFAVAFMVSFLGHHLFTFAGHGDAASRTLRRFAVVAGVGFLVNETLLFLLLITGPLDPKAAVFLSTGCAAASTFVLSRHWAFAGPARAQ